MVGYAKGGRGLFFCESSEVFLYPTFYFFYQNNLLSTKWIRAEVQRAQTKVPGSSRSEIQNGKGRR